MKNVKYYAGLFDADGSFDIWPTKRENDSYYINIKATLYQQDVSVFTELVEEYGVEVKSGKGCSYITLHGTKAQMFMENVKNYLVIKKKVVEYLLSIKGTVVSDLKSIRSEIQNKRKELSSEKDWPSRKWMAGYIDGDGCILSSFRKKDGNIEFKLSVVSHYTQQAGLLLMMKAFGGFMVEQGDCRRWNLTLSVTKGKQVLNHFSQHLKVKKPQADLVLKTLEARSHLKSEGASWESNLLIHKTLQELKLPATTKS